MPGQSILRFAAALLLFGAVEGSALAQRAGGAVKAARADHADMAKGSYLGDIVSDSRGAARPGVRATVARIGANRVRVSFDDARLPAFDAQLIRESDTLRNVGGAALFLLDLSKRPLSLKVTADGASWAGVRQ